MFKQAQFQMLAEEIFLKHHFELPVSFAMIGVNGAFLTGRFELSFFQTKFRAILLSGKAKDLRFPINMLLVDKTGKAAHTSFERSDKPVDLTNLQTGRT